MGVTGVIGIMGGTDVIGLVGVTGVLGIMGVTGRGKPYTLPRAARQGVVEGVAGGERRRGEVPRH